MFLIATTMHARVNGILLTWLLISPLAYYFLSIPAEKPIFTFDRFVILMLTGAILFAASDQVFPVPHEMKMAAVAWVVFILFAFTSLVQVWGDLGVAGTRLIVEAFIFPALLALFVIRVFPAHRYIRPLHTLIGLTSIYCAAIGLIEILTDTDLLPIPGAVFYGGDQTGGLPRVNGPFDANYCLAMIGAICFFLLLFLKGAMPGPISRGRRMFHWTAVASAITMALLPQFRTLVIAMTIVALLELYQNRRINARLTALGVVALIVLAIVSLPVFAPTFFENRVADPSNFYARIAQQQQTWELFRDHPVNGVGFANFMQAIQSVSLTSFHGIDAVNSAHNSLASLMAETGVTGTLPFIIANVLWFVAFFRLRRRNTPRANISYRYFLAIFICYWAMAFTLTSAYERDLNLWYMFACAIIYKLADLDQVSGPAAMPAVVRSR